MKKFLMSLLAPIVASLVEEEIKNRVNELFDNQTKALKNHVDVVVKEADGKIRSEITQKLDHVFFNLNNEVQTTKANLGIFTKSTSQELNNLNTKLNTEVTKIVDAKLEKLTKQLIDEQQTFLLNLQKELNKNTKLLDIIKKF